MIFTVEDLRQFIKSTHENKLQYINIKSKNLDIVINTIEIATNLNYTKNNKPKNTLTNIKTQNIYEKAKHSYSKQKTRKNDESQIYSTIISPMVGTFYRSPAPNEPAFIEKNDTVQKKQTVCLIEAMKLMNEIEAEVSGEIVEILVSDGDIIDCGQALMTIKVI